MNYGLEYAVGFTLHPFSVAMLTLQLSAPGLPNTNKAPIMDRFFVYEIRLGNDLNKSFKADVVN